MSLRQSLEYLIVILFGLVVGLGLGYLFWGHGIGGVCTDCGVSVPQVRNECDKQFFGTGVRAKQLDAGAEDEFLVAFVDPSLAGGGDPNSSGGYSSPSGSSGYPGVNSTPVPPALRGPGYVMVRVQPQFGYDYSGSQSSSGYSGSSYDTNNTAPGTPWNDVTVTVARYVNPLRNDAVCNAYSVRFREGKFETYCEIPNRFEENDSGQASYRIFVRNESRVPVEYCIVSNCDASAPYGQGSLCTGEQPTPGQ